MNHQNYAIYPSLAGKTVFITGGGSGIGASIVEHFARQQARVGFVDIDQDASRQLVARIADEDAPQPVFVPCDLRDVQALRAAVASVRESLGPIEILVNNAAHDERHTIESVTPEYWDDRMAVNLRHQFFAAQAVIADMERAGGGVIINMGSSTYFVGQGGMPGYSAAKAAVWGLTRSLASDLGPRGIRVNCVVPGWIMTDRQIELWLTPESEADLMRNQCLQRKIYPDDVARVVLFMAADDSAACTNQLYIVDGGWI